MMVLGSPQQRNLAEGMTKAEGMAYAAEMLGEVCRADSRGVVIAIEPLGPARDELPASRGRGMELIERIGSPQVHLHLDCKAMATEARRWSTSFADTNLGWRISTPTIPIAKGRASASLISCRSCGRWRKSATTAGFPSKSSTTRRALNDWRESIEYMRRCWGEIRNQKPEIRNKHEK